MSEAIFSEDTYARVCSKVINQIKDLFIKLDSTKRLFWVLFSAIVVVAIIILSTFSLDKMLSYFFRDLQQKIMEKLLKTRCTWL